MEWRCGWGFFISCPERMPELDDLSISPVNELVAELG